MLIIILAVPLILASMLNEQDVCPRQSSIVDDTEVVPVRQEEVRSIAITVLFLAHPNLPIGLAELMVDVYHQRVMISLSHWRTRESV